MNRYNLKQNRSNLKVLWDAYRKLKNFLKQNKGSTEKYVFLFTKYRDKKRIFYLSKIVLGLIALIDFLLYYYKYNRMRIAL